MRKLIAGMKISIDGKIEGPKGFADWVEAWSDNYDLMPQIDACLGEECTLATNSIGPRHRLSRTSPSRCLEKVYPFREIAEALAHAARPGRSGKILLRF